MPRGTIGPVYGKHKAGRASERTGTGITREIAKSAWLVRIDCSWWWWSFSSLRRCGRGGPRFDWIMGNDWRSAAARGFFRIVGGGSLNEGALGLEINFKWMLAKRVLSLRQCLYNRDGTWVLSSRDANHETFYFFSELRLAWILRCLYGGQCSVHRGRWYLSRERLFSIQL